MAITLPAPSANQKTLRQPSVSINRPEIGGAMNGPKV